MCVVKDELETILCHKDIVERKVPVLFFANKMDKPKALSPEAISEALELSKITDRPWQIVPSNALSGKNLDKGIKWISGYLTK
jgi:ADP-ribosylation factor-like protein 6